MAACTSSSCGGLVAFGHQWGALRAPCLVAFVQGTGEGVKCDGGSAVAAAASSRGLLWGGDKCDLSSSSR